MNTDHNRGLQIDAAENVLNNIENAIAEKSQSGHADETRHGFAARLANATPPENKKYQQALKVRILAELASDKRENKEVMTIGERIQTFIFGRSFSIGFAATLILILVLTIIQYLDVGDPLVEIDTQVEGSSPQLDTRDIEALVDALNNIPAERTVLVFPAEYALELNGHIKHRVVPLKLSDDLAPASVRASLDVTLPSKGLVDFVVVNQEASDTTHLLRTVLEQRLYRLDETEVFGALERSPFVVGPDDAALELVGAIFEGGIELEAAGVLDNLSPGAPLRMAFDWRITEQVNDSLVMFAHLVHEGRPISQRDAVPGNGLFPVTTWKLGEVVRDQKAMLLPPDLPVGDYELQVGIYSSNSGKRYSLIEPAGGSYVTVKRFTIESASLSDRDI